MTHTTEGLKHRYRLARTGVEFYDTHCDKWRPSIIKHDQLIPLKNKIVVTADEILNCESAEQIDILMVSKGSPRGGKVNFKTRECTDTGDTHIEWEIVL